MVGKVAVGGISKVEGLVILRILGARSGPGLAGRALSGLGLKGINVSCVTSFVDREGTNNLACAISAGDLDQALGILQGMHEQLGFDKVDYVSGCAAISVYGPHFSESPAIAGTLFETISEAGVEILLIATSFSTVTFLTREDQADFAIVHLNKKFLVP